MTCCHNASQYNNCRRARTVRVHITHLHTYKSRYRRADHPFSLFRLARWALWTSRQDNCCLGHFLPHSLSFLCYAVANKITTALEVRPSCLVISQLKNVASLCNDDKNDKYFIFMLFCPLPSFPPFPTFALPCPCIIRSTLSLLSNGSINKYSDEKKTNLSTSGGGPPLIWHPHSHSHASALFFSSSSSSLF